MPAYYIETIKRQKGKENYITSPGRETMHHNCKLKLLYSAKLSI